MTECMLWMALEAVTTDYGGAHVGGTGGSETDDDRVHEVFSY